MKNRFKNVDGEVFITKVGENELIGVTLYDRNNQVVEVVMSRADDVKHLDKEELPCIGDKRKK